MERVRCSNHGCRAVAITRRQGVEGCRWAAGAGRQSVSKGLFGTWLSRKHHRVDRRQGAPEVTIGPLTSKSPAV